LYLSFAVMAGHWGCYLWLIIVWIILFGMGVLAKDFSLKQKPGWAEYSERSYILLFRFSKNHFINLAIYGGILFVVWKLYQYGNFIEVLLAKK